MKALHTGSKTTSNSVSVDAEKNSNALVTVPTVVYPGLEKEAKAYIDSMAALEKKLTTINPTTGNERKVYYVGNGICVSVGPLGGSPRYFYC